ncbi:unnamed protein product [marine sediment metagenome]|uniref:Uncharacterized protein n=1 Tax=marine sediment metagenome TaxID=412755 RepID=X1BE82_9ZZZZ
MSKRMFVISIIVIGLLINGFSFAVRANPAYEDYKLLPDVKKPRAVATPRIATHPPIVTASTLIGSINKSLPKILKSLG